MTEKGGIVKYLQQSHQIYEFISWDPKYWNMQLMYTKGKQMK